MEPSAQRISQNLAQAVQMLQALRPDDLADSPELQAQVEDLQRALSRLRRRADRQKRQPIGARERGPTLRQRFAAELQDRLSAEVGAEETPSWVFEVLGAAVNESRASVRRKYVQLLRKHHPDTGDGDAEALIRVQGAWDAYLGIERKK